jgi:nicotinate-nucleotide pyrophosphorylase (carboxylating)
MMKGRGERVRRAYLGKGQNFEGYHGDAEKVLEKRFNDDARRDITVEAVLKGDIKVYGVIQAKEKGILAGIEEVLAFYARHNVIAKVFKKDGDRLKKDDIIAELEGNEKDFLKVERIGLNLLGRMSGIATQTKRLADIAGSFGVKIAGTRKTVLNFLDKKAIFIGGGLPHRMGLFDAILIKDNHLSAIREEGGKDEIERAIERAYTSGNKKDAKFIEIEVSTLENAVRAAKKFSEMLWEGTIKAEKKSEGEIQDKISRYREEESLFPCIIMLDNMKASEVRKAVNVLKKKGLYHDVLLEASGGVIEKNLQRYASTGIDVISVGAITHSAKALDVSQKIIKRGK